MAEIDDPDGEPSDPVDGVDSDAEVRRLREQLAAAERAAELRRQLEEAEAELSGLRGDSVQDDEPEPETDDGAIEEQVSSPKYDSAPPLTADPPKGGGKGRKKLLILFLLLVAGGAAAVLAVVLPSSDDAGNENFSDLGAAIESIGEASTPQSQAATTTRPRVTTTTRPRVTTTTRPRVTTTTRPRVTTTTSNRAVAAGQPRIELICGENQAGTDEWLTPFFGYEFHWDQSSGFGSILLEYGDGKSYTSWSADDAEANAFWHKYYSPGRYTVRATITDGAGQKDTASCQWTWEAGTATAAATTTRPRVTTTTSTAFSKPSIEILCPNDVITDNAYSTYLTWPGWSSPPSRHEIRSIRLDHGDGASTTATTSTHFETEGFFEHEYYEPGRYTFRFTITDAVGQTATDSCTWTWSGPSVFSYSPDAVNVSTPCPSGYYLNADNWCIPSPTLTPYKGWTARCRDGYYSYSATRSGTCSYHGGVDFFNGELSTTPSWTVPLDLFGVNDLPSYGWEPNYGGSGWTPKADAWLPIVIPSEPCVSAFGNC